MRSVPLATMGLQMGHLKDFLMRRCLHSFDVDVHQEPIR
jgi:hypothetical protein